MFSPDGKRLVFCGFGQVSLVDFPEGGERWTVRMEDTVQAVRFSPDGKTVAAACRHNTVRLLDVSDGTEIATLKRTSDFTEEPPAIRTVALSPDGKTLATAGDGRQVFLRDIDSGRVRETLKGFEETVTSLAFSPDGVLLAAASNDRKVKVWEVRQPKDAKPGEAPKAEEKFTLPAKEWVAAVAFSPDKTLAIGGYDKAVRLVSSADGKELAVLAGHEAAVRAIAFSADGKRLASGSGDNTIKLWNLATKAEIATLEGHSAAVRSVAFTPNGKGLISGAEDGTVRLWDADGTARASIEAHRDMVWTVAVAGKNTAISGGADGQLILWDLETKELRQRLPAHTDALTSLAIAADGRSVVSGSLDRTIKIWRAREKE
jgi:WD40 repeat protein